MKDIAKMREKMEREIRLAEMSNEIEEKVGISCEVSESGSPAGKAWIYFGDVTKEQAAKVLKVFPWTERTEIYGKDIELSYILSTHRYPKDPYTMLEIRWIHNEWTVSLRLPIKHDDEVLRGYFKEDRYELENDTIGLYYGAVSPREKGRLRYCSVLSFNCGSQIRYKGGYFKQTSEGHAECIVAEIIGE